MSPPPDVLINHHIKKTNSLCFALQGISKGKCLMLNYFLTDIYSVIFFLYPLTHCSVVEAV